MKFSVKLTGGFYKFMRFWNLRGYKDTTKAPKIFNDYINVLISNITKGIFFALLSAFDRWTNLARLKICPCNSTSWVVCKQSYRNKELNRWVFVWIRLLFRAHIIQSIFRTLYFSGPAEKTLNIRVGEMPLHPTDLYKIRRWKFPD